MSEKDNKISVIISAYDKHRVTVAHVRECMKVDTTPHEIIVVNDGGTPDLKEMLAVLPRECQLIYARINEDIPWNYNGACNLGAWLSTGDYLMFEDNDNIPTKTVYGQMLEVFKTRPEIGRVCGIKRMRIEQQDLDKPSEEWVQRGKGMGPNMGTSMMKREVYMKIKGQDERFCGRYGWMFYDFRARFLRVCKDTKVGHFWYVIDAQSNLDRKPSSHNFGIYRRNARNEVSQSPEGIINFTYTVELL